jgi:ion channel-forming bestrophin family protein
LRGEEGTHYEDLYHLVKFLPAYALPAGISVESLPAKHVKHRKQRKSNDSKLHDNKSTATLPLPATTALPNRTQTSFATMTEKQRSQDHLVRKSEGHDGHVLYLSPARDPPPYHVFDFWPMSMFVHSLQQKGKKVRGRKALRDHARNQTSGNVPLEISLYLSSYVASMQQRGADGSSCGSMSGSLGQMVDALTGLERILQTPIPFSYAVHLWTVTLVWLIALPFQILEPLGWLTIPGCALAAFVYCGLMKCAEELENPFGYDYNDLNLDHFTHNIIRRELQALTSLPMPDLNKWAFSPDNDAIFDHEGNAIYVDTSDDHDIAEPDEWVKRGEKDIRAALSAGSDHHHHTGHTHVMQDHSKVNKTGVVATGAIATAQIIVEDYSTVTVSQTTTTTPGGDSSA